MNKYLKIILELNKENYIKWWLLKHYRSFINRIIALKQTTPLTLNGTILHKLLQIIIYGKTEQDGEPTPETPVEIKNVEGKNKFDINDFENTSSSNMSMTITNNVLNLKATGTVGAQSASNYVKNVDKTKTYTISCKAKKIIKETGIGSVLRIYCYGSNDDINYSSRIAESNISYNNLVQGQEYVLSCSVTGYKYYRFVFYNNGSTPVTIGEETEYWDIQVEEGPVTPFVPYNSIEFKVENKNLFDKNNANVLQAYFLYNENTLKSNTAHKCIYIPCKPNTTYTVQKSLGGARFRVGFSDNIPVIGTILTNTQTPSNGETLTEITATSGANSKYLVAWIWFSGGTLTFDEILDTLQIEEESTASPYVEHQEQTEIFTFEDGQYLAEGGYLADDGIHNVRSHVVLDGVSTGRKVNIVALNSSTGLYYCQCNNIFTDGKATSGANVENLLCSHFQAVANVGLNHCYRTGTNGIIFVFVLTDQTITTPEQANAWLQEQYENGTPVKVEYPLETPTPTPYTPTQQAQWNVIKKMYTYKDQTNVNVLANLDGIEIDIGYYGIDVLSQETLEELSNGRGD